jgi:peptide/nickel transport system substrate-binding protein
VKTEIPAQKEVGRMTDKPDPTSSPSVRAPRSAPGEVFARRLNRREAVIRLAALGAAATGGARVLSGATPPAIEAAPTISRGASGTLKLLNWQAPTILNPHLAIGTKDWDAARLCCEPLLTLDAAGNFAPVLAATVPSRANGQVAADGKSVIYQLKRGVRWADGRPFTSDDVVFTYQYVANQATAASTYGNYANISRVEPLDPATVKITFKSVTPGWYVPFVGRLGGVLPRHALDAYVGDNARNAPYNTKAFGTGPYLVESFQPGDLAVYGINPYYREPNKPAFSQVQLKGGGDAVSAARAVFATGEYDYAFNLQVEWPVLQQVAQAGNGQLITSPGGGVEMMFLNMTDPNRIVDGQRSSVQAPHPFLTDARVRQALALSVDRETIAQQLYGREGDATANVLTIPTALASKNTRIVFDIARANQILDQAGYRRGPDGVRLKDAVRFELVFLTTTNSLRQKEQEVIKAGWQQLGVATTIKAVDASAFFSSAPGNTDSLTHFYADVEMFNAGANSPFPARFMNRFNSGNPASDLAQRENNWSGYNICRWVDKQYNEWFEQALVELDPEKDAELWRRMNDRVVEQAVAIAINASNNVAARVNSLDVGQNLSPFDGDTHNIADWRRLPK